MGLRGTSRHVALAVATAVLLVVVSGCVTEPGDHLDLDPERNIHLGQGNSMYTEHDVVFNVECVHDVPIDIEDLSVEFVLTSDGEAVGNATSSTSEVEDPVAFPEWRVFRNVTVPHQGCPKDSLGFIVTLYYKGTEVDQYVFDSLDG